MDKDDVRADKYQWMFNEVKCFEGWAMLVAEKEKAPEIKELKLEIVDKIVELSRNRLNDMEYKILELWFSGMTQTEIGQELGLIQASIFFYLWGDRRHSQRRPGIVEKIAGAVQSDPEIIAMLYRLYELDPELGLPTVKTPQMGEDSAGIPVIKRRRYKPRKTATKAENPGTD